MKNKKNISMFLSLVVFILITSACSAIPKRDLYTGYIMGLETRVIADHIGDKITKVDTEIKVTKNLIDVYLERISSMDKSEKMNEEKILPSLALKSFNNFSFKMFNGVEINVENSEKEGITLKILTDYKKVDLETIKSILKFAPQENLEKVFDENNLDSFSKFEEELLKQGLKKK